jgi:hypothetical protein
VTPFTFLLTTSLLLGATLAAPGLSLARLMRDRWQVIAYYSIFLALADIFLFRMRPGLAVAYDLPPKVAFGFLAAALVDKIWRHYFAKPWPAKALTWSRFFRRHLVVRSKPGAKPPIFQM